MIALARLGLLRLLPLQFSEVLLPQDVLSECTDDRNKPGANLIKAAAASGLFEIVPVADVAPFALLHSINAGEAAALILALERHCPALVDERRGRRVAADLGIPLVGTLGVLLQARLKGQIERLAPLVSALNDFGYRLSPQLVQTVLQRVGEV
ncbi:MAG: DUF3368 domain-containing protein [Rhodocyclaceae bacterium]|nr:DUF3368 domain-containing protein [Rhodocyclaceae bacterium]